MRWCRYNIELIGPTLRTAIREEGITPDMVVPIAPNTFHPSGRKAVHTTPSFPFANCFHWIDTTATVRIRMREEDFEHNGAVMLSCEDHTALMRTFEEDYDRIGAFFEAQEAQAFDSTGLNVQLDSSSSASQNSLTPLSQGDIPTSEDPLNRILSASYLRYAQAEDALTSLPSSLRTPLGQASLGDTNHSSPSSQTSSGDEDFDVFGLKPDPTTGLIPLVDAWLDIDQRLTEDMIPNPDELEREAKIMLQ